MNKFRPATIPAQVIYNPGDLTAAAPTTVDPNPVVAELKPVGPPPKPVPRQAQAEAEGRCGFHRLALPRSERPGRRADTSGAEAEIVSALQPAYIVCQRAPRPMPRQHVQSVSR